MNWPPERKSPAPPGWGGNRAKVKSLLHPQNSRSHRRAQEQRPDTRARFARRMTFAEFGYRHGRPLDYENFRDRRPCDSPRPSPEHRMLARRWPSWP
jgi:hypothetical protein